MSMFFIHVTIKLLLSSPVGLWYLGIVGIDVVTVLTLDIDPLLRQVMVLLVQGHAVLPVGDKAALVTLDHLQLVSMILLLMLPDVSDSGACKATEAALFDLTTRFVVLQIFAVLFITVLLGLRLDSRL